MYPYLVILTDIRICVICLGIYVLHWDTCHCLAIHDIALGYDKDAASLHLPHGPHLSGHPAWLDHISPTYASFSLMVHTWEVVEDLDQVVTN